MNRDYSQICIYSKCPFVYLFFPSFYFNALINMEKWIGLLYANVLFYLKPTLPNRAVQNKIIKCTFQLNKYSAYIAVKPRLNILSYKRLLSLSQPAPLFQTH